jgi:hypothetical protein
LFRQIRVSFALVWLMGAVTAYHPLAAAEPTGAETRQPITNATSATPKPLASGNTSAATAAPKEPETANQAAPAAKPEQTPKPSAAGVVKPVKPKVKRVSRTEAEVSAYTSETTDQLYGRINLTRVFDKTQWWIKGGYSVAQTRTYNKNNVNETDVDTFTFDAQYRQDRGREYRFVSAVGNIRNRTPYSASYGEKTGYYMLTAGVGKTLMPGLEGELAMAKITRYEENEDHRITPVYTLRLKTDINSSMLLDGDTHFVQPFSDDQLVDSRISLTYRFTPSVSMRLTYVANNMLSPVLSKTGWDKSFRVSLVFSSTKS